MRTIKFLLALVVSVSLCACAQTTQPENQAIAIALGVDKADEGCTVSVLLPIIRPGGKSPAESTGSSQYEICSATASNFSEALTLLDISLPLTLNLSQLKLVTFSQEIASDEGFGDLVSEMYQMHRLYTAAYTSVCMVQAKDMLTALSANYTGARLSSAIVTGLEGFIMQNSIPDTRFADLYYDMQSIYGSPIAIFSSVSDGSHTTRTAPGRVTNLLPGAMPREGGTKAEFVGTALFRDNAMVGTLTALETTWMNLLRGKTMDIPYSCDGKSVVLSPKKAASIHTDTGVDPMEIRIECCFVVSDTCSLEALTKMIEADVSSVISKCQSLGIDPFLFSQRTAASFIDIPSWQKFNYPEHYHSATHKINVIVELSTN